MVDNVALPTVPESIGITDLIQQHYLLSGTVGEATLTVDQLASHQHWIATSHNGWGNAAGGNGYRENGYNTDAAGGSQAHTHDISNGATGNASILPPYYALSYIIRIM